MRRHLRLSRPSPALVVAVVALIVALGGTGYAALNIPRGSVGRKQLHRNAVTSVKVKNRSLKARDFRAGQLPAGPAGPTGATGATGATGPAGADGADGSALAYAYVNADATLDPNRTKNVIGIRRAPNVDHGGYCLELPFKPKSAVATDAGGGGRLFVQTRIPPEIAATTCGADSEVLVTVLKFDGTAFVDNEVMVLVN